MPWFKRCGVRAGLSRRSVRYRAPDSIPGHRAQVSHQAGRSNQTSTGFDNRGNVGFSAGGSDRIVSVPAQKSRRARRPGPVTGQRYGFISTNGRPGTPTSAVTSRSTPAEISSVISAAPVAAPLRNRPSHRVVRDEDARTREKSPESHRTTLAPASLFLDWMRRPSTPLMPARPKTTPIQKLTIVGGSPTARAAHTATRRPP